MEQSTINMKYNSTNSIECVSDSSDIFEKVMNSTTKLLNLLNYANYKFNSKIV